MRQGRREKGLFAFVLMLLGLCLPGSGGQAQTKADAKPESVPQKVILDTDIGTDIDDAYALALLLSAADVRVLGVMTAYGQTQERAELAAKLLRVMGQEKIPVCAGRRGDAKIYRQYEWARADKESRMRGKNPYPAIQKEDAVSFLRHQLERYPGEITLIAIGPLTNLGDLLTRYPETKSKIKRIVIMGGAVYRGYGDSKTPTPEYNIQMDVPAARIVFTSGVPLTMAGLEVTAMLRFERDLQRRLYAAGTPTTDALAALTVLWGEGDGIPTLFDAMAVGWALTGKFCDAEQKHVVVEDNGLTRITDGASNVTVLVNPQKDAFLDWVITTIAAKTAGRASKGS